VQTYEQTTIVIHRAPARRRAKHAAPASRVTVRLATGAAIVAVLGSMACGYVATGLGFGRASGPAPAVAAAERACRAAVQVAFVQATGEDVDVWGSQAVGSAVVVSGEVERVLTGGVLGPHLQTNRYTCTATTEDGRIITSVT